MISALALAALLAFPASHPVCEWHSSTPVHKVTVAPGELSGTASYYAKKFEGRRTASGETFRQEGFTAAHRTLPLGALVLVRAIATGRQVAVRINDRGPFKGGFVIDLTTAAAGALGVDVSRDRSVAIEVLTSPD